LAAYAFIERSFPVALVAGALLFVFILTIQRRRPAFAITAISILLSLALAEYVVGFFIPEQHTYSDPNSDYGSGNYFSQNPELGYQPVPGAHTSRLLSTEKDETIYDVIYTVGTDGFRITPGYDNYRHTINLFGDSFAYGEGLNDNQTLAFYLQEQLKTGVKNYGIHGYGMHQALAILQRDKPPAGEINIFLTVPWHALRSSCKPDFAEGTPRYVVDDGKLTRNGNCPDSSEFGIFRRILKHSNIYKLVTYSIITRKDIELYLAILNEAFQLSRDRGQKVMVAFIKASSQFEAGGYSNEDIMRELKASSDVFVDVSLAIHQKDLSAYYYIHELDQHPSALANAERARLVADAL
jgi:hypothetical protein